MMKKILSVVLATLLLCSCFVFSVSAVGSDVTISDDYSELYINSDTYFRVQDTSLYVECDFYFDVEVTLSEAQSNVINSIDLNCDEYGNVVEAVIDMKIGDPTTVIYMNSDALEDYTALKTARKYTVDFISPEGNSVRVSREALFDKAVILRESDLYFCDYYYVGAVSSDGAMSLCKGMILSDFDGFYYFDFEQNSVTDPYDFDPTAQTSLNAYKITNSTLKNELLDAENKYFGGDLTEEEGATDVLFGGAIVILFIVAILLLGVAIVFLICGICSKTQYRKMHFAICIAAGCAFAVVVAIVVYVLSIV